MPGLIVWKTQYIDRLKRDMDRIFDTMWGEFAPALRPRIKERMPFIDLTETKRNLILRAEIPGIEPDDIEIDITNKILTDKKAGELNPDATYPKGTINYLVNKKLMELAEGLSRFGKENNKENGKEKGSKKGDKKKS